MNDIADQYRTIATGAGWIDKTTRGRLRLDGADRASFLQALVSNEVASLAAGHGTYALYLTPQGRLIADLHVFVCADYLIVDVPAVKAPALAAMFDNLIFTEDVRVSDVSTTLRHYSIVGGQAAAVLARAVERPEQELTNLSTWSHVAISGGFMARTDDVTEGSWDVVIEATAAELLASIERAGAIPASGALIDAMRIDAGRPAFGVDMNADTIPLEAGLLDRAISQAKGCYVGQEVIIRVLHRGGGRVARRLVRLSCDANEPTPAVGAIISIESHETGRVTSAAFSPRTQTSIALGYVHRDAAEPDRRVTLTWDGGVAQATITGLAG